jgi:hypothetical protein
MLEINYLAVVVAAVAAFIVGAVWYSPLLFGNVYMKLRGLDPSVMTDMRPPVGEIVGEFVRALVVTYVFARLVAFVGVGDWMGAVLLGVWVWVGFPAMILLGSVIHENVPWKLAAIHTGDWLVKLLLIAIILAIWR